ncbi:hypothetical protein CPB85DRAFT_1431518 [Mucidula mucida]|nr:hypothetical protein CPB85DRAFT_1431518 [Mucidula mucida]
MSTSIKSYRIIVVSPCDGVGKTSLCGRFTTGYFTEAEVYDPFQEYEYRKMFSVDGEEVILDMLDTLSAGATRALLEEIPGLVGVTRNQLLIQRTQYLL